MVVTNRSWLLLSFGIFASVAWLATSRVSAQSAPSEQRWYKGNLHTHTINSDGDSSPDAVARWYKEHRYQFLALTDHNYFTDPGPLEAFFGADERFLLVSGEEVTSRYESHPVHVNAFQITKTIAPKSGSSVLETVQRNVDAIREAGGMPSLNHPNFRWGVSADDLKSLSGLKLFEVFNGHPTTNDLGDTGHLGLEAMWDVVLTAGRQVYGIAVDDAHAFKTFSSELSNPGRGWVTVRAPELSEATIMSAIDAGNFYSSTGVELTQMVRSNDRIEFTIDQKDSIGYTTEFIGGNGRVLERTGANPASYARPAGEPCLRAVVTDSNGLKAWLQPIFSN